MIANLSWFDTAVMSSANFAISSLMNWVPLVLIALISLWGVKSFFDYIIYKSRSSVSFEKWKSLDYSFFNSPVSKHNKNMKYWYNEAPVYDNSLKNKASLLKLKDKDDVVDFTTFSSFFEDDWPYSKYGIDKNVWESWDAPYYYFNNKDDFFSDDYLSAMRDETRKKYWDSLDMADISRSEKNDKYDAFCSLQDNYSYKKFVW